MYRNVFYLKNKKIDYPIYDNKHSFTLKVIENYTENDPRLFDSKNSNNMIELNRNNNVDFKKYDFSHNETKRN
jgi:hypothetical protein